MIHRIPEVRALIDCAKRFLADEASIQELHGHAAELKTSAHLFGGIPAIGEMADEWIEMSNRYWNEWGLQKEPLTKEDFKRWLQAQIGEL